MPHLPRCARCAASTGGHGFVVAEVENVAGEPRASRMHLEESWNIRIRSNKTKLFEVMLPAFFFLCFELFWLLKILKHWRLDFFSIQAATTGDLTNQQAGNELLQPTKMRILSGIPTEIAIYQQHPRTMRLLSKRTGFSPARLIWKSIYFGE